MSWSTQYWSGVGRIVGGAAIAYAIVIGGSSPAEATKPYGSLMGGTPGIGPGLAPPTIVPGKEYSHDRDHMITAVGTAPLSEQVVAWDGSGGVGNGVNYTGERIPFTTPSEVDAIANHGDFLFKHVQEDRAHLIWSFDDLYHSVVPAGASGGGAVFPMMLGAIGPVPLANGNTVGGAAELNYEMGLFGGANAPETQGVWAKAPEINEMPTPGEFRDIDGVELWGPEPGFIGDANKYSLDIDAGSLGVGPGGDAISIWNSPSGTPYIERSKIVAAVTTLLGAPITGFLPNDGDTKDGEDAINVDALMVRDFMEDPDSFDRDPTGGMQHDEIIFSIRQIVDPFDSTGFYATGSELFVLDATGAVKFLDHGGHLWDDTYALTTFGADSPNGNFVYDLNAVEAVGQSVVPEPTSSVLVLASLVAFGLTGRRRAA